MQPETMELIKTLTPWVMSGMGLGGTFAIFAMKKTFAAKKDVAELQQEHELLKSTVKGLPNRDDWHQVQLTLEGVRGELKVLNAKLEPLQHISDLRLENDLKDKDTP
ncbi:DUF2730 family protein [Vibrio nigripulchritudo]|uniref:DUF2730 family protein n=1 Tax=Vibrio nigripulchritudo TaxID=28173 RepID=UPI0007E4E478|nr:DUF2730 family protein [Vibrio nigripulchritudo]